MGAKDKSTTKKSKSHRARKKIKLHPSKASQVTPCRSSPSSLPHQAPHIQIEESGVCIHQYTSPISFYIPFKLYYHTMKRAIKLAASFTTIIGVFVALQMLMASQLELEDALYLTRNTIREFESQHFCKSHRCVGPRLNEVATSQPPRRNVLGFDLDLDSPLTNVVNSVFPMDLIVSYNASNTTHDFVARYASFSPVLNGKLRGKYAIFPGNFCEKENADDFPEYKDRILIVLRGKCTFVRKVANALDSGLRPRAVVVANNEPYHNLITMYSGSFNADGLLNVPVLFISFEDYQRLQEIESLDVDLVVQTAAFDNWINLMLLMAVSPPLLILACYMLIRGIQLCRRKRSNVLNQRLVRKLPVYIYNRNHLVPTREFYNYLTATHQTDSIPLIPSSSEDLLAMEDIQPLDTFVINGTDLYSLEDLHLLVSPKDFYPTFKCSICLDRFAPLRSRVLVLDCHHVYHEKCLSNWLINFRRTCPLCNETLSMLDTLPLLTEGQGYGSFSSDLERSSSNSGRVFSTTAVRSLQLDSQTSHADHMEITPAFIPGTLTPQPTTSPQSAPAGTRSSVVSTPSSAQSNVDSEASFVTTHTHLVESWDTASSNYITPRQSMESSDDDDTELIQTSSMSTIRNSRNALREAVL